MPSRFSLRAATLLEGFRAWLIGYPIEPTKATVVREGKSVEVEVRTPVKYLRLLRNGRLPSLFKRAYDNNYKPIIEGSEESVKSIIENQHIDKMDFNFLSSIYKESFEDAVLCM